MKVGDYVRTNLGRIAKITKVIDCEEEGEKPYLNYNDMCVYTIDENFIVAGSRGEIIASSKDIKDLIKVGDIISFEYPTWLGIIENEKVDVTQHLLDTLQYGEKNEEYHIKSIVTKEQFESMEYKIGE